MKFYRKGQTVYAKGTGFSIACDDNNLSKLVGIATFLSDIPIKEDLPAVKARSTQRKRKPAPVVPQQHSTDISMSEELARLIASGVKTEEGIVSALSERLIASGKKSPARSVSAALRHAKNAGLVREESDGSFALARIAV